MALKDVALSSGRFVFVCVCVCMSVYVCLSSSVCLSVCLSMMHWSLCICVCLSVCVYLSISDLFVCARSVYVYVCLYVYIYLSICYMWWSVYDMSFYHVILFSACTSASLEPSYVLRAIGADEDLAHSSIRLEICPYNYNLLTDSLSLSLSLFAFLSDLVLDVSLQRKKLITRWRNV